MAVKGLVSSMIKFLTQQLEEGGITDDSRESLEVVIQCLESVYSVRAADAPVNIDLLKIYENAIDIAGPLSAREATPEEKAQAELLKNKGNDLMQEGKTHEAITQYSNAIELDRRNAVYYCNRAAAYNRIGNYRRAIKDCETTLQIDPTYGKAYGRMGLAFSSMDKHKDAKDCYKKALELEPDNESHKNNLELAEEKLAQQGVGNMGINGGANASGIGGTGISIPGLPNVDPAALLSNPTLIAETMANPEIQNLLRDLMSGNTERGGVMEAIMEAGQQFASQVQSASPELFDNLRRQMGGGNGPNNPGQ